MAAAPVTDLTLEAAVGEHLTLRAAVLRGGGIAVVAEYGDALHGMYST